MKIGLQVPNFTYPGGALQTWVQSWQKLPAPPMMRVLPVCG